jgi:hypothetical protein
MFPIYQELMAEASIPGGLDRAWAGVKMGIPLAQFWTYGTSIYIWATGVGHFQNYVAMKIS